MNAASSLASLPLTTAWTILPQFGVIEARGDDHTSFLHGQFTNNMQQLDGAHAHLAGYCSPQGRLLASFLAWRADDAIRLLLARDLQHAVQKRLGMFVLRARVSLVDASAPDDGLIVAGFIGDVRDALADITHTPLPCDDEPAAGYAQFNTPLGALIRLPEAAGRARYLLIGPKAAISAQSAAFNKAFTNVSPEVWDWFSIRAGEPRIVQATASQFVPQSVNFDLLGGVNFHKGCYPGQEVVARTQYRGTIKRRMALAHVATTLDVAHAGVALFHAADPGQPCGMIVNAALSPDGGVDLLAELKLEAMKAGDVHTGAVDGPALQRLPLPYDVPNEAC